VTVRAGGCLICGKADSPLLGDGHVKADGEEGKQGSLQNGWASLCR